MDDQKVGVTVDCLETYGDFLKAGQLVAKKDLSVCYWAELTANWKVDYWGRLMVVRWVI